MFGIGRGVATGVAERLGKFQLADAGTLFLDEIGELPLQLQGKLLRALQEKEVHPVGCRSQRVNVSVVASTNADLARWTEKGRFRRDLYYRVAGCVLRVPPLRERRSDIPVLLDGLIRRFGRESGKSVRGVTVSALQTLVNYPWPGNVRELEHEAQLLVGRCRDGQPIESSLLSDHIAVASQSPGPLVTEGSTLATCVANLELRLIREALERSGGIRSTAAGLLGISRNGLALKMRRLGLLI
jgi:transcriptional regulator with PAS, ATPase and Fis domain